MARGTPPRYVPTLTEVVGTARTPEPTAAPLSQDQLVHRVMQRVDLLLDRRLREAVATVVLEHTRTLGPALRDEIQAMVSEAVSQALADELAAGERGPARPAPPA